MNLSQISVFLENKPGTLNAMTDALAKAGEKFDSDGESVWVDDPDDGAQMEMDGASIDLVLNDDGIYTLPVSAEAVEDAQAVGGTVTLVALRPSASATEDLARVLQ